MFKVGLIQMIWTKRDPVDLDDPTWFQRIVKPLLVCCKIITLTFEMVINGIWVRERSLKPFHLQAPLQDGSVTSSE